MPRRIGIQTLQRHGFQTRLLRPMTRVSSIAAAAVTRRLAHLVVAVLQRGHQAARKVVDRRLRQPPVLLQQRMQVATDAVLQDQPQVL